MTQREYFEQVIIACESVESNEIFVEGLAEIKAKSYEMIASLDRKNEKRSSAESKEKKEVAERQSKILDFFKENPSLIATREDVAKAVEGVTVGQITSACTKFVKEGLLTKTESGKGKDKHTAYTLAPQD